MANPKNKKTLDKDALKQPDEFLVLNTKLMTWIIGHKLIVIGIVVVILLIGAGFSGLKYRGYRQEINASELTAQATRTFLNGFQAGDDNAFADANQIFDEIFSKYGKTKNAGYAYVMHGNIAYQAKEYERALNSYQTALAAYANDSIIAANIQNSIGYCYMALDGYDKALEAFQKVANNPNAALQDDALYNMGVIYAKMDAPQKSAEAFEQILAKYPDSVHAQLLKNRPAAN